MTTRPQTRRAKILATLGPATEGRDRVAALHAAGADAFRLNFSHGDHERMAALHAAVREVEADAGLPLAIVADLQGPKLRIGAFAGGEARLKAGAGFRLDADGESGDGRGFRCRTAKSSRRSNLEWTCCWTTGGCACGWSRPGRGAPIRRWSSAGC